MLLKVKRDNLVLFQRVFVEEYWSDMDLNECVEGMNKKNSLRNSYH